MRNYSTIATAIWRNEEFCDLSVSAQRLYLLLITQQDITPIGTLPMTLNRWAGFATDTAKGDVIDTLAELTGKRFIIIDWDNEELLVRTFVRWDGGHTNPKRLAAIKASAAGLRSRILGPALASELDQLGVEHQIPFPQVQGHSIGDPTAIPESQKGDGSATDRPRSVVTYVTTDPTTHTPQTTTHTPGSEADASASADKPARPTRIPESFAITEDMRRWASETTPGLDIDWHTQSFIDFWRGKSGSNGTKLDWVATWRNWMRSEHGKPNARRVNGRVPIQPNGYQPSTSEIRAGQAVAIAERIRRQEEAEERAVREIES